MNVHVQLFQKVQIQFLGVVYYHKICNNKGDYHKIIYGISANDFRIHDIEPGKDIGYFSNDNAGGELKITDLDYQSYFKCNGPH